LRDLGVSYFPSPDRAFRAIARLAGRRGEQGAAVDPVTLDLPHGGVIPEHAAKAALAPIGVRFPQGALAHTADEARAIADRLGYPVVIKAQARELSHKSDVGGVVLGLGDSAALTEGWDRLHANLAEHAPGVVLDGVLVEKMGAPGLELIVGARNDPDWGLVILVGFGGIQAEVRKDVRLLPADLPVAAIVGELRKLKSAALLDGWRGAPALDVGAVAELVAALGRALLGTPAIREIDLNPVVVYPRGEGAVALDALILADG
jgi:acyl-CoA synthetase (NDP forming)